MKRLLLIRHAKSSWDYPMLADFDRPLNPRGRHDAPMMALRLQALLVQPFRMIASPAVRALTTALLFAETFDVPASIIRLEPRIYDATPGTLLHLVNTLDDGPLPFIELPTCGIAMIEFDDARWQDIVPGAGRLTGFRYPKEMPK